MSRLSIVMPIYARKERLRLALWGLLQQTDRDFDLHIVNDGGDRGLREFVFEFGKDLDIHYHYLAPRSKKFRAAKARNLGIRHTDSERILCLDADVVPAPDIVTHHRKYGAAPVVVCGLRKRISSENVECLIYPGKISYDLLDRNVTAEDDRYRTDGWRAERAKLFRDMTAPGKKYPHLCHSFHISYPARELKSIGGFWEKMTGYGREDQELAHRLCMVNCTTRLEEQAVVYHLDHPLDPSISNRFTQRLIEWRYQRSLKLKSPIRNGGAIR